MATDTTLDPDALELIESIRSGKALDAIQSSLQESPHELVASAYLARLIRQNIHQQPELAFEEHRTASMVASMLRMWGYEVHEGIGKTGLVGVMTFGSPNESSGQAMPGFGFRADMDALPIQEQTGKTYASRRAGIMHAAATTATPQAFLAQPE